MSLEQDLWYRQGIKNNWSRVQATIVAQLHTLDPGFLLHFNVTAIFQIKEDGMEGIQISTRQRGKGINFQVLYNRGSDTYEVRAYAISHQGQVEKIYESKEAYVEGLIDSLNSALGRRTVYETPFFHRLEKERIL